MTARGRVNLAFEGEDGGALKESATESVRPRGANLSKKLNSNQQYVSISLASQ